MKVDEVIKFGTYSRVLKIRFTETHITERVLTNEFVGCNLSVQPFQIKREQFVNLLTCHCCYRCRDHVTNDYPQKNTKQCSNCTQGHIFNDCQNTEAQDCLNCICENRPEFNTHHTMAMSCPIKKRKIKEKQDE